MDEVRGFRDRKNRGAVAHETVIWRYLTLPKLLDLIIPHDTAEQSPKWRMPFTRLDSFSDAREGRFSPEFLASYAATIVQMGGWGGKLDGLGEHTSSFARYAEQGRQCTAASCWFASAIESAAMWERYAPAGVAIRTTVGKLMSSLHTGEFVGWVGNVDYYFQTGTWDGLDAAFSKDPEFSDEREVRFVISKDASPMSSWSSSGPGASQLEPVTLVPVDLLSAVDNVVLSPVIPDWQARSIHRLLASYIGNTQVTTSLVGSSPHYVSMLTKNTLIEHIDRIVSDKKDAQAIASTLARSLRGQNVERA